MRMTISTALMAAAVAIGTAIPAQAAPMSVEEIALYKGADRQAVLEAGAKKEGKVLIYATGTQIKPIIAAFEKQYPYLKVELFRSPSAKIAKRTIEEYTAGRHVVDGFELSTNGLVPINQNKILVPFHTSEAAAYGKDAWGPGGNWLAARLSFTGIGVNTKTVPAKDAPKSYDDLLDPRWKGKMAISGSRSTAVNWVAAMMLSKGEDYLKKLSKQDIKVHNMTGRALANLMVSGEVAISPTTYNSHVFLSQKKGSPLTWYAPGAVPVTDTAVAITKHAPHPHATMLFIDFTLTKEGQKMYQNIGYASSRNDLTNRETPEKLLYLASRPDFLEKFSGEWGRLYDRYFLGKGK